MKIEIITILSLISTLMTIVFFCFSLLTVMNNNNDNYSYQIVKVVKKDKKEDNSSYQKNEAEEDYSEPKIPDEPKGFFIFQLISLILSYLIVMTIILIIIRKERQYVLEVVKYDIIPYEFKKCLSDYNPNSSISLRDKQIFFKWNSYFNDVSLLEEIIIINMLFYHSVRILECFPISFIFSLFINRKKSLNFRWKLVNYYLDSYRDFFLELNLISYFLFRLTVYICSFKFKRFIICISFLE